MKKQLGDYVWVLIAIAPRAFDTEMRPIWIESIYGGQGNGLHSYFVHSFKTLMSCVQISRSPTGTGGHISIVLYGQIAGQECCS